MKKRILALAVAGCLLLSGCRAMLERSYSVATPHADRPTTAEDPSVLRVENYRELVSAVLYLVSQQTEEGVIQLHNYDGDEEADLAEACLEVATQDPLGAYAVDYIKHELSRVVSYYQATLAIRYRRSAEQVKSIVSVTGASAIRDRLQEALGEFPGEVVLRLPYFFGDEAYIGRLLREAYYAAPGSALGFPKAEVKLYPESGQDRIVEIVLEYPEDVESLKEKREKLSHRAEELLPGPAGQEAESAARLALTALWGEQGSEGAAYDPDGGSTAYAAIVEGRADSQGMALGYALLCRRAGVDCAPVEGVWEGQDWWWVSHTDEEGNEWFVDPVHAPERRQLWFGAEDFAKMGYFSEEA